MCYTGNEKHLVALVVISTNPTRKDSGTLIYLKARALAATNKDEARYKRVIAAILNFYLYV